MNARQTELSRRLEVVRARIQAACSRAGRKVEEVTLVAVTKTVEPEVASDLAGLGVRDFGENRPQELWRKAGAVPQGRWHLIGHLQRNKVEKSIGATCLIHSVDSVRLLEAIEQEAVKQKRYVEVLLEVNCSGEEAKQGFEPAQLQELVPLLQKMTQVRIRGLMTMAALAENPEAARPAFKKLRENLEVLRTRMDREQHPCDQLSMGMSGDFEVAIEEGATLIRLGTILVGELPSP